MTGVYYGLTFGATAILGDPYGNFVLGSAFELLAVGVGLFTTDRVGRKWTLVLCQGSAGVACVITGLLNGYPNLAVFQTGTL